MLFLKSAYLPSSSAFSSFMSFHFVSGLNDVLLRRLYLFFLLMNGREKKEERVCVLVCTRARARACVSNKLLLYLGRGVIVCTVNIEWSYEDPTSYGCEIICGAPTTLAVKG